MIEVKLYGHLRARFGRGYRLHVSSAAEAVRALCAVVPGFKSYVQQNSEPGYKVIVSKAPITSSEDLRLPVCAGGSIGIVPVVAGKAGLGKIIGGVALIALSFVPGLNAAVWAGVIETTWSAIAFNVGVSLVLGGVSQMLAGSPKALTPSERPQNQPSYVFNGAVNVTGQGHPVPVCLGRIRCGSQVISTGLSVAQIA